MYQESYKHASYDIFRKYMTQRIFWVRDIGLRSVSLSVNQNIRDALEMLSMMGGRLALEGEGDQASLRLILVCIGEIGRAGVNGDIQPNPAFRAIRIIEEIGRVARNRAKVDGKNAASEELTRIERMAQASRSDIAKAAVSSRKLIDEDLDL